MTLRKKLGIERNEAWLFFLLALFVFLSLTAIDYIVHHTLYQYGLQFDYKWADPYWTALNLSFLSVALLASGIYWISDSPQKSTTILVFLTIFGSYLAGLLDVMWFIVFARQLPPESVVWWWTIYYRIFGIKWTSMKQVALTGTFLIMLANLWMWKLYGRIKSMRGIRTHERRKRE